MARPLRIEFPGALYHVTTRGNARHWRAVGLHYSIISRLVTLRLGEDTQNKTCPLSCNGMLDRIRRPTASPNLSMNTDSPSALSSWPFDQ